MAKPGKKRRKRGGRKSRSLSRSVLPILSVAAIALLGAVYFFFTHYQGRKARLRYAQLWEIADRQFSRRALDEATKGYESIASHEINEAGIESPSAVKTIGRTNEASLRGHPDSETG